MYQCVLIISQSFLLETHGPTGIFKKIEISFPKEALLGWNWHCGSEKKNFKVDNQWTYSVKTWKSHTCAVPKMLKLAQLF